MVRKFIENNKKVLIPLFLVLVITIALVTGIKTFKSNEINGTWKGYEPIYGQNLAIKIKGNHVEFFKNNKNYKAKFLNGKSKIIIFGKNEDKTTDKIYDINHKGDIMKLRYTQGSYNLFNGIQFIKR